MPYELYLLPWDIRSRFKVREDGCWIWQAARNNSGYGSKLYLGKVRTVHKVVYEALVGPVVEGMELDHLCRNKACCNPAHLEPVTLVENNRRKGEANTHCPQGHEYTPENTYTRPSSVYAHKECRICRRQQSHRFKVRQRQY